VDPAASGPRAVGGRSGVGLTVCETWRGGAAVAAAFEQRAGGSVCGLAWERRWGGAARLLEEIVGGGYGSSPGSECPAVARGVAGRRGWQGTALSWRAGGSRRLVDVGVKTLLCSHIAKLS